ncbi:MAG: PIN domain-containing protein [Oscillospiraceae bacterium]|jgi:predicted nucleic-acid-binding protein|nr:PIN domain-containing protein [Oscillospiraceae bacterium]
MVILDTNAVLRLCLGDIPEQRDKVKNLITTENVFVPPEVFAEAVFVMSSVYQTPRAEIASALAGFLDFPTITTHYPSVVYEGLRAFSETKLEFIDCLMAGYQKAGYAVFSFDKKLNHYLQHQSD